MTQLLRSESYDRRYAKLTKAQAEASDQPVYWGTPCKAHGHRWRYVRNDQCCLCQANWVKQRVARKTGEYSNTRREIDRLLDELALKRLETEGDLR